MAPPEDLEQKVDTESVADEEDLEEALLEDEEDLEEVSSEEEDLEEELDECPKGIDSQARDKRD